MKRTVKLTERELKHMISESVKKILNEIGDTAKGQFALGAVAGRANARGDNDTEIAASNKAWDARINKGKRDNHYKHGFELGNDVENEKNNKDDKSENSQYINGYEYVDLGLPSGTLWATCNVGASSPNQSGLYFAWGETDGYRNLSENGFYRGEYDYDKGFEDGVTANMGGNWHMPTKNQCRELIDNCTCTYSHGGALFTSNVNGNTLFIPGAGTLCDGEISRKGVANVWSSSLCEGYSIRCAFELVAGDRNMVIEGNRAWGNSLRGVIG